MQDKDVHRRGLGLAYADAAFVAVYASCVAVLIHIPRLTPCKSNASYNLK